MVENGFFITLYDKETLKLYLDQGIYGFLMPPQEGMPTYHSRHFNALADYGCGREGTHVFFFLNRKIYYGGQLQGSKEHGAFYLNGQKSPLGRNADAPVVWDESKRENYRETGEKGVFEVKTQNGFSERCQPYLLKFRDELGLQGKYVSTDEFYLELGDYPYPLSSNVIAGMGFCTMSPGETNILLGCLKNSEKSIEIDNVENVILKEEPVPFSPEYGISSLNEAEYEAHLEAYVTSNPDLLPSNLRPEDNVICRQTPVSPFKPLNQIDKADVCYFGDNIIRDGTIPNSIIELKNSRAGKKESLQVKRYLDWLYKQLGKETVRNISIFILSPSYTKTFNNYIPEKYGNMFQKVKFSNGNQSSL